METEFLTVKNSIVVTTQWGKKRVINFTNGEATWINDTAAMWHINNKQEVEVIRDAKGKLTILEKSVSQESPTPKEVGGKGLQHVSDPLERVVEDLLKDGDLPEFSDTDKIKIARYIKSQSKILKLGLWTKRGKRSRLVFANFFSIISC